MKSCIPNGTSINPKTHHTKFYCKGLNFNEWKFALIFYTFANSLIK